MRYFILPQAESDIEQIIDFISLDKPSAAQKWFDQLISKFNIIADIPEVGVSKSEIRQNLRLLPFGNYLIIYQFANNQVAIVRIIHGAQDWQNLI